MNAANIRELQQRSGMTIGEFASVVGVTRQTVHNWLSEKTVPTGPALQLLRMMNVLNTMDGTK